jgi:nitroimidazol reductase NimA-like FMN-containing flavoprotein (pyridoxamine 5'-phosphate oxidase superfamily)/rhodanese-related sulfurtransferase
MHGDRTTVGRLAERGAYDFPTVAAILDAALICHVGFVADDGQPIVLPTIHARIDRALYLHGSVLARWLKDAEGRRLCVTATLVDDIVLARSVFQSSMNYRSVVALGTAQIVRSPQERQAAFEAISEHVCPGRWKDARLPNDGELSATIVVKMPIEQASAKIRSGPPKDPQEDLALPYWAGLVPVRSEYGDPVADPKLPPEIAVPAYVRHLARRGSETIGARELRERGERIKVFDIRKNPDERKIPGSIRADAAALETGAALPFGESEEVVLYCGSGNSCRRIAKTLRERGYRAIALDGGYRAWLDAGLPTEENP